MKLHVFANVLQIQQFFFKLTDNAFVQKLLALTITPYIYISCLEKDLKHVNARRAIGLSPNTNVCNQLNTLIKIWKI